MTSKTFLAEVSHLSAALSWIRSKLEETALSKGDRLRIELALEEAIVNVMHHTKSLEFRLSVRHIPGQHIEFDLSDAGLPFNPLLQPLPEEEPSFEKQKLGGKGLILMRECTDALLYRREEDQNILTLVKKIH